MTTTIRRLGAALIGLLLGMFALLAVAAGPASASGEPPTITLQPVDTTGYVDGTVQFTAHASATTAPTVFWEYSFDNGATWNWAGQTTDTYTLGSLVPAENGDLLEAVFTNPYGTTISTPARLTVLPAQPAASFDTTDLSFGYERVHMISDAQTVTATNSGTRQLGFGTAYVNSTRFFIFGDTCSTHALEPGGSCSISVAFAPDFDGRITGILVLPDNVPPHNQEFIDLDGYGGEAPTLGADTTVGGVAGQDFNYPLSVTGVPAPATLVTGGALPPGLALDASNTITGRPSKAGTYYATIEATNGVGDPAYQALTFTIAARTLLTLSPASITEGGRGTTTTIAFSYRFTRPAAAPGTFHFATKAGTAAPGSDYVQTSGTATVAAGQRSGQIAVTVKGDGQVEPDEQFTLVLSQPAGIVLETHSAVGTIVNDD